MLILTKRILPAATADGRRWGFPQVDAARETLPFSRLDANTQSIYFRLYNISTIRVASASPQISGEALKRFLSMFSDLIFDSRVVRGMPNLAAAPVCPDTRPPVAFRASSTMFFSCSSSLRGSSIGSFGFAIKNDCDCCGNQVSSIENVSVSQRITERSM